jgi:glycosyltransferase involved in cell wall biosynthesis
MLLSYLAYAFLALSFGFTLLVARLGRAIPRRQGRHTGRILVTGTFYNTNWYVSHLMPLSRSGAQEVILVGDESQVPVDGVRFACPPWWFSRVMTRAAAKLIWMIVVGLRCKPDLYMGYHLFPGACSALIAARLLGRPACYQMTGGPVEVIGGGSGSENALTTRLAKPSALLERMATAVIRRFDLVVVRGQKARDFLAERGIPGTIAIITGSVCQPQTVAQKRSYDLVFVGRMTELKQPRQFVEIVAAVRREVPSIRAAMIGDGSLLDVVRQRAAELQVADCLDLLGKRSNVQTVLSESKVFVLTSRSEGMSIAMAEAMAAGAVPVVADVGELGDLVENGVNGYLIEPDNIAQYAARIVSLLQDPALWTRLSQAAAAAATRRCSVEAVAALWRRHLDETIKRAPGATFG